jgi:hypothetical protein
MLCVYHTDPEHSFSLTGEKYQSCVIEDKRNDEETPGCGYQ